MTRILGAIFGMFLGAGLGLFSMVALAFLYVGFGGDEQAAGVFSFFPPLTMPLGALVGGIFGFTYFKKEKSEYRKNILKKYEEEK